MTCERCRKTFTHREGPKAHARKRFCSLRCAGAGRSGPFVRRRDGSSYISANGYRYVRVPDRKAVPEHVLKAEGVLRRRMRRGEVVHHVNGDVLDNRNSNLIICTRSYHNELHMRMSYLYQRMQLGGN